MRRTRNTRASCQRVLPRISSMERERGPTSTTYTCSSPINQIQRQGNLMAISIFWCLPNVFKNSLVLLHHRVALNLLWRRLAKDSLWLFHRFQYYTPHTRTSLLFLQDGRVQRSHNPKKNHRFHHLVTLHHRWLHMNPKVFLEHVGCQWDKIFLKVNLVKFKRHHRIPRKHISISMLPPHR